MLCTFAVATRRSGFSPCLDGGGHERGFRSGTGPGSAGRGLGSRHRSRYWPNRPSESRRLLELRERLHAGIGQRVTEIRLNGHPVNRLPGNLNLSFAHVDGEALMMQMREIAVSSGSACSAADPEPSHVLMAMGLSEDLARASLRFGLGRFTTARGDRSGDRRRFESGGAIAESESECRLDDSGARII